jgi:hypothetical protein
MANFIHLDAAIDGESVEGDFMAPVRVRDDEIGKETAPRSIPSFTDTQPITASNEDFTLNGLKSHLVQNLTKKPKVLCRLCLLLSACVGHSLARISRMIVVIL